MAENVEPGIEVVELGVDADLVLVGKRLPDQSWDIKVNATNVPPHEAVALLRNYANALEARYGQVGADGDPSSN